MLSSPSPEDEGGGGGTEEVEETSHRDSMVTGSSCVALKTAVATLNRLDDFHCESIGTGFFSEVFKVTHKVTGQVMVLKMNKLRSNRPNMLKEVQLMNQLSHPNILGFMGVCVHEGQLHALTEYINGGRLELIIQDRSKELSHRVRMKLGLDIALGMEYLHSKDVFHRDLTSKNVLIKTDELTGEMTAVVGDFGFAAKIPRRACTMVCNPPRQTAEGTIEKAAVSVTRLRRALSDQILTPEDMCGAYRLATVGSAYWMSPECLKGEWYDEKSDVFSYGIILCEMIARVEADPDVLTRTANFGLDYIAFTMLCDKESPPPQEFLKLAFSCCTYEPRSRPSFSEIVKTLRNLLSEMDEESTTKESIQSSSSYVREPHHHKLSHRRSSSEDGIKTLGLDMAKQDLWYKPAQQNPFTNITSLKGHKKILNLSSSDTTESCCTEEAEVSSEEGRSRVVAEPVVKPSQVLQTLRLHDNLLDNIFAVRSYSVSKKSRDEEVGEVRGWLPPSLPSSPTFGRRGGGGPSSKGPTHHQQSSCCGGTLGNAASLFKPIRACSSGSNLISLDDHTTVLRRRGSCESGFFSSVGEDFCTPGLELVASSSVTLSSSSAASSLSQTCCESLTDSGRVGASRCLSVRPLRALAPTPTKRSSSVYTDSSEDIPTLDHDHQPQQIHKMVEYFERKQTSEARELYRQLRQSYESGRSASVNSGSSALAAMRRVSHRLLLCEGAVSSKLQLFDKKS